MPSYSALEAISPAIERTKIYLFKPFRLGRFLKLALVACLVEGAYSGANVNFSFPFPGPAGKSVPVDIPALHLPSFSVWIAVAAVALLISLPIGLVLTYLLTRLRFSYFDCLLDRHDSVSVGWRKYHRQAVRYLVANICIGLLFLVAFVLIGVWVWWRYRELFTALFSGQKTHLNVDFFALIVPFAWIFLTVAALSLVAFVSQSLMNYCVLPRMALDGDTVLSAIAEVWAEVQVEKGQFALFLLMRMLLPVAASLIAFLVVIVPFAVLVVIGVVVGFAVHAALHSGLLLVLLAVLAGMLAAVFFIVVGVSVGGTIATFTRNYGMLFYAGRYPEMAARLWPVLAPPPASAGGDVVVGGLA